MSLYSEVLDVLERLPESAWTHPLYHAFSYAAVGEVAVTLYRNGWLNIDGIMLGAWPFKRRGAGLFKRVRDVSRFPIEGSKTLAAFRAAAEKMSKEEEKS